MAKRWLLVDAEATKDITAHFQDAANAFEDDEIYLPYVRALTPQSEGGEAVEATVDENRNISVLIATLAQLTEERDALRAEVSRLTAALRGEIPKVIKAIGMAIDEARYEGGVQPWQTFTAEHQEHLTTEARVILRAAGRALGLEVKT